MRRILIIDDSAIMRQLLKDVFEMHGDRTIQVYSATDAFAVLGETPVNLVLLDLMMPGMDGFEFLKALRSDSQWKDLPVIVLSGCDDHVSRARAAKYGIAEFVAKSELLGGAFMQNVLLGSQPRLCTT